mmetsp:Transcript_8453/g.19131  ORF Transcript_8453/g.19131 Transcript_8453/m.19131 type:complete len:232 (+) Transcript_8453:1494-2189(+)
MSFAYHVFKFSCGCAAAIFITGFSITRHWSEKVYCAVAPKVSSKFPRCRIHRMVFHLVEFLTWHEFNRIHTQSLEVRERFHESCIRSRFCFSFQTCSHTAHVRFVHNEFTHRTLRRCYTLPIEVTLTVSFRNSPCDLWPAIFATISLFARFAVARTRHHGFRVRVQYNFTPVKSVAILRIVRPIDAIAIQDVIHTIRQSNVPNAPSLIQHLIELDFRRRRPELQIIPSKQH